MRAKNDNGIQSNDSIETYSCGMKKDIVCTKEEIKCNNVIRQ